MENIDKNEIASLVKEAVEEVKKEYSVVTERKLPNNESTDSKDSDKELKAALKALAYGNARAVVTKDLSEGGATTGAPFVPEQFSEDVVTILGDQTVVNKFTRLPMTSDTMNIPTITTKNVWYTVSEGSQITASDIVSANVQLQPKELAMITGFSNQWLEDAYPISKVLMPQAQDGLADYIESIALSGSPTFTKGALTFASVGVTAQNISTSASLTNLVPKDLTNMIYALEAVKPNLSDGAMFFLNPVVYGIVASMTASTNEFIFMNPVAGNPATINGYPVYKTLALPSTAAASKRIAIFGNPKWIYWGDRTGLAITLGNEGTVGSTNLFEKNSSALRLVKRADFQLILANTFSYLETNKHGGA